MGWDVSYTDCSHLYWLTRRKKGLGVRGGLLQGEGQGALPISASILSQGTGKVAWGSGEKALGRVTLI